MNLYANYMMNQSDIFIPFLLRFSILSLTFLNTILLLLRVILDKLPRQSASFSSHSKLFYERLL